MPILLRKLIVALSVCTASLLQPAWASIVPVPNRVAKIDQERTTPVAHNVSGRLKGARDLGQAPLTRRLEGVTLHFNRSEAQQAALNQLLIDQQTPGSAQYHHWLTPAEFGARFGLSSSDLSKVTAWLTAQNLTVSYIAPSNTLVTVGGTVAQMQQAFGASIHSVTVDGEAHIANITDPILPAALGAVVSAITGLDDFRLRSRARRSAAMPDAVRPAFTAADGVTHYLAPADAQTIYNAKPLLASAINGTGARIAVVGQTDISLTDFAAFRSAGALPASSIVQAGATLPANGPYLAVVLGGTADPGSSANDIEEAMLDVEWAGAMAPNVGLVYVNSTDVFTSLTYAITSDVAPIVSISYGLCEPELAPATLYSFDALFQLANAQGQTIVSPGGDSGATDCDFNSMTAADGLAVDFPASSPNTTAVGGTQFVDQPGSWNTTSGSGGSSALGYIPETVWNETSGYGSLAAGGGGASVYFPKPTWQVGTGVPADLSRDVPDLALNAGVLNDSYLVCVSGSCSSGFSARSAFGGTSVGVPTFAGMLALVEQKIGMTAGLGNINPKLYGLGGSSAFHDVTSGNNNSPCTNGSPDCQSASSIGFSATPGYDQASGWGSIDVSNLANAWLAGVPAGGASATGSQVSITTVALPASAPSCGINASSISVDVSVASLQGAAGVPTGTAQLLIDGVATGTPVALTGGAATLTLSTSGLSSGSHNLAAAYSGDTVFAGSKGYLARSLITSTGQVPASPSIIDVVSTSNPDFSFTPCLPTFTVASGATSGPLALTATSFNGFSGTVTFSASTDASLLANFAFSNRSVSVDSTTPGTTSFTLTAYTTSANATLREHSGSIFSERLRRGLLGTGSSVITIASLVFFLAPRRRRITSLLVGVVTIGVIGLGGCGSGSKVIDGGTGGGGTVHTNTAPGTYLVNLTATGSNSAGQALVHTTVLTIVVQ